MKIKVSKSWFEQSLIFRYMLPLVIPKFPDPFNVEDPWVLFHRPNLKGPKSVSSWHPKSCGLWDLGNRGK